MTLGGGIRRKLWLGIGALLLLLLLTSGLAVRVGLQSNAAIEQTFRDNGDSIAYMHDLTDALDQMQALLSAPAGRGSGQALAKARQEVQRDLAGELQNTTEAGEGEAARQLQAQWDAYGALAQQALAAPAAERGRLIRARLEPLHQGMRALAWRIAGLNLMNARFRDHGQGLLAAELRWMALLLLLGVGCGVAFAVALGRSLVEPVVALTEGVRGLGVGRFDGRVEARGEDELAELGRAFNTMASRLHGYEQGFRARLLRTQRTTQLAINSCTDPVAVFGLDGRVDLCNRAAERSFGLRPGWGLPEGPLSCLALRLGPVLEKGERYEPEAYGAALRLEHQGAPRYILPRLQPVVDAAGRIVGAVLVLADVTGLRRLDEMKSSLLATVSHELKNPLTSLRMAAHLLQEDAQRGRIGREAALLAAIKEGADRLHGALEGLMDLGRLESGDLLKLEVRPAEALVQGLAEPLRPVLEAQGLRLELSLEGGLPDVAVDPGRLGHVLSNLVDNAVRHSPVGGVVTVGAERDGSGVRLWVRDQGPGVPEPFRQQVFERFFRVPGQEPGTGLGLGLAIAREIAELHGGSLSLDPGGPGARFSLILPATSEPH
jgi:signal transduction histidine kinase